MLLGKQVVAGVRFAGSQTGFRAARRGRVQGLLVGDGPLGCGSVGPIKVRKVMAKQPTQPGEQLAFARAREAVEVAMHFQERVLNQVRGTGLGLETEADFRPTMARR